MGEKVKIQFQAVVYKVQTLVDGGIRITLDLPESAIMQMAQLVECKQYGKSLDFAVSLTEFDHETKKGAEGESAGLGRRRSANRRDKR